MRSQTPALSAYGVLSQRRRKPSRLPFASPFKTNRRCQLRKKDRRKVCQLHHLSLNAQSYDSSRNRKPTNALATLQAVSKAIETGNWYEGTKESSVDAVEFSAWQKVKDELTVAVNPKVILRVTRIAVPKKLQERVVNLAHEGHQGVVKRKSLLREKVLFPGIDKMVKKNV